MTDQKIGQAVDALGVTADLDDEDMVVDCIVLLKVLQADGSIAMSIGTTDTTDWINQKGLLHSALELTEGHYRAVGDD
ncbi:hypothetical protein [Streptomyces sp. NPDC015125]|uniref:hypothetical protein n=1 Tax=Streptomyces sp. NPDC015125 TaxID=3364938 RepID=UPI00370030A7